MISFSMSMVMIALSILVPLNFELVGGMPPNEAGVRLIPMTGGTVLGSFVTGRLITRTGRYRIFPIVRRGNLGADHGGLVRIERGPAAQWLTRDCSTAGS